jgi:hypothetical protein
MSVYKVERKVDTVIIEMDSSNAEALLEVLGEVDDLSIHHPIHDIRTALALSGEIREPSPLYKAEVIGGNLVHLDRIREPRPCDHNCDPTDRLNFLPTAIHYLDCPVWKFAS